jgi:hypothetical protein
VRSKDPSDSFDLPWDFPLLFFAVLGGTLSVLLGAISLSAVLFIVSPGKRSTSKQGSASGHRSQPVRILALDIDFSTTPFNSLVEEYEHRQQLVPGALPERRPATCFYLSIGNT